MIHWKVFVCWIIEYILHKYASTKEKMSSVEKLKSMNLIKQNVNLGIGHNRWATHTFKKMI